MLLNISYLLQMIQKMNVYIEFELGGCPGVCCKNIEMDKKIYINYKFSTLYAYIPECF